MSFKKNNKLKKIKPSNNLGFFFIMAQPILNKVDQILTKFSNKYGKTFLYVQFLLAFKMLFLGLFFVFKRRTSTYVFWYFGVFPFIFWISICLFSIVCFKELFFKDNLKLTYKKAILNRQYLRIIHFWKNNFKKSYYKVPIYNLFWHIPLLIIMSFYNGVSTRYKFLASIYYLICGLYYVYTSTCSILLLVILIMIFLMPLIFITFFCKLPLISRSLKSAYGNNALNKLNFN